MLDDTTIKKYPIKIITRNDKLQKRVIRRIEKIKNKIAEIDIV